MPRRKPEDIMRRRLPAACRELFLALTLSAVCFAPNAAIAADADCDTVDDAVDNCPARFNPDQSDIDGDLAGDRCDSDRDGDTVANDADNCPRDANVDQTDTDADNVGDTCDQCAEPADDVVNRRGCSIEQTCPCSGPEDDRAWKDHRSYVRCVKKAAKKFERHELITSEERYAIAVAAKESDCGVPVPTAGDNDGDGVSDATDNCPSDSNPGQRNTDGDAFGNACDADADNDTVLNDDDNCPTLANAEGQGADADSDGAGDACDVCSGTAGGDAVDKEGCSIAQACPCAVDEDGNPWASHTKYRRCVVDEVFRFRTLRILTAEEADAIRTEAGNSDCGDRPAVCE
jgi:hypothetical protein